MCQIAAGWHAPPVVQQQPVGDSGLVLLPRADRINKLGAVKAKPHDLRVDAREGGCKQQQGQGGGVCVITESALGVCVWWGGGSAVRMDSTNSCSFVLVKPSSTTCKSEAQKHSIVYLHSHHSTPEGSTYGLHCTQRQTVSGSRCAGLALY
jgi:hypothetical protein